MYRNILWTSISLALLAACGGEALIEDRYSLDYLDAKAGKPLVYPEGVDRPEQSSDYTIPALSSRAPRGHYDVNELAKPPRLVPLPSKDDDKKNDDKKGD